MAEGEHLSEQSRHLWLADKSRPYEGTEKHPQGRLFNPGGSYTGDPMKLHPSNWLKQSETPAHEDTIAWHSSHMSSLPRSDDYEDRAWDPQDLEEYDEDTDEFTEDEFATDSQERPMGQYGSVVGMHLGNLKAAGERSERERDFIHPARVPEDTIADPPKGTFATPKRGGAIVGGEYKAEHLARSTEPDQDRLWTDSAANYSEAATDEVEEGKTVAYRNDVEGQGSTSFRTLPETVRTWSEDVMNAKDPSGRGVAGKYGWHDDPEAFRNVPHPGLVHLAEKGFDPVVMNIGTEGPEHYQMSLNLEPGVTDRAHEYGEQVEAARSRTTEFEAGHTWQMRKPTS